MNSNSISTIAAACAIEIGTLVCTEVLVDNNATLDGARMNQDAVRRMMAAVIARHLHQPA